MPGPRLVAASGAGDGRDAEGDLGRVAALFEVLHPALDLLDLAPDAGQLALNGKRVLHLVGPVVQIQERLFHCEQVRSRDCKSTYSSVTSCP